jgi:Tol biopolymer transport system component
MIAVAGLLLLAPITVVIAIDSREPPLPAVTSITPLTHDGKTKTDLVMLDPSRLSFAMAGKRYELRLADNRVTARPDLDEYRILDASPVRGELLANRPHDRGAEQGLWAVRTDGSTPRRIGMVKTLGPAAWSHDGKHIAYVLENTVYVTDSDGGGRRTIGAFTARPMDIRWSPDDDFLRVDVFAASDRRGTATFYDVALDGGQPKPWAERPPDRVVCCGAWIPGSDDFLFQAGYLSYDVWVARRGRGLLWRRPGVIYQLTSSASPTALVDVVPAPDGSRLYALKRVRSSLLRYDLTTGAFVPYLGGMEVFDVEFSPDGKWLTYIDKSNFTLWRANADGTGRKQLTPATWLVDASAWRPDGQQLAIRARAPGAHDTRVYLLDAAGGTPQPLVARDVEQGSPTWAPDGKRLTFGDVPESYGHATGTERIHIFDLRTRETTDLPDSTGLWSSRWSPDGRYIAATRIADRSLFVYDFATKAWRDLGVKHVGDMTWSRDSQYLYCDPEAPEVWFRQVRIRDGQVVRLIDLTGETVDFGSGLALDGSPLLLRHAMDVVSLQLERR